jgi:saccharopine dehydrogenase (NAD+, L-lysine-forming)
MAKKTGKISVREGDARRGKVLIIGAGGVGGVVAHKCAQAAAHFPEIILASRTLAKCQAIAAQLPRPIRTAAIDADNVPALTALLKKEKPFLVINVALPYQDLPIMDACLAAGVHYLDTANYEPKNLAKFEYKWQWAYQERFTKAGLMALLGSGFDPGVTNVFCAYAQKKLFDRIEQIDILDANAGDHGLPFATNFNPEINLREVSARGRYFEHGEWLETEPLSWSRTFDFPAIGPKKAFLLYHEELESLAKNIPGVKRLRFWMTFSDNYLMHMRALQNIGMLGIVPVEHQGRKIIPIQFLKTLLPDPSSLGPRTKGKTNIGCLVEGTKGGKKRRIYIYNVCDHQECYREVKSQAISYTTGVPAAVGAIMMASGAWLKPGVWNMEQLDPEPFLAELARRGLPWHVIDMPPEPEKI